MNEENYEIGQERAFYLSGQEIITYTWGVGNYPDAPCLKASPPEWGPDWITTLSGPSRILLQLSGIYRCRLLEFGEGPNRPRLWELCDE